MLKIYTKDLPKDVEVIRDVEREFLHTEFELNTPLNAKLLFEIEGARIVDARYLENIFHVRFPVSCMSTSSMGALLVANCPDKIIDTLEIGVNALEYIITDCDVGQIYIHDILRLPDCFDPDTSKDIWIDGTLVHSTEALGDYIYALREEL